jgi:hypothetical protein
MNLARTQAALYKLIVDAPDAEPALADRIVQNTARLSPLQRVEIYGNQYPARMYESLSEDYPTMLRLLGEEEFWELTQAYARAYPSQNADLGRFGSKLEEFLRTHRRKGGRADLVDLVRLEWARTECFLEADAPVLPRDALAKVPPEAFAGGRLRFIAALRHLSFEHDALALWDALESKRRKPRVRASACHAVIWRQGYAVYHASLRGTESEALGVALRGGTLAEAMEPFAEHEDGAKAAFKALARWLAEGMVSAFLGADGRIRK